MELSSPRFKALALSAGFTLWFFVITSILGVFALEYFVIFIAIVFPLMQFLSIKVANALNTFAMYNTKFFLGILFVLLFSLYGIFFKILRIDLLRTKKQNDSYWQEMEQLKPSRLVKGY